ncbi:syntaxin 5, putative [Babesia caballi]|uniref:Syntaxin 5, putative n=1 Tax=Babesia caballi TaxID=5871 RepID=A0AAV4LXR3_BABCB|nr:syntaxin 5, putative [Babesia caballi]
MKGCIAAKRRRPFAVTFVCICFLGLGAGYWAAPRGGVRRPEPLRVGAPFGCALARRFARRTGVPQSQRLTTIVKNFVCGFRAVSRLWAAKRWRPRPPPRFTRLRRRDQVGETTALAHGLRSGGRVGLLRAERLAAAIARRGVGYADHLRIAVASRLRPPDSAAPHVLRWVVALEREYRLRVGWDPGRRAPVARRRGRVLIGVTDELAVILACAVHVFVVGSRGLMASGLRLRRPPGRRLRLLRLQKDDLALAGAGDGHLARGYDILGQPPARARERVGVAAPFLGVESGLAALGAVVVLPLSQRGELDQRPFNQRADAAEVNLPALGHAGAQLLVFVENGLHAEFLPLARKEPEHHEQGPGARVALGLPVPGGALFVEVRVRHERPDAAEHHFGVCGAFRLCDGRRPEFFDRPAGRDPAYVDSHLRFELLGGVGADSRDGKRVFRPGDGPRVPHECVDDLRAADAQVFANESGVYVAPGFAAPHDLGPADAAHARTVKQQRKMYPGKFHPPSFGTSKHTHRDGAAGGSNLKYEKLIAANLKHIRAEILYTEHNIGDLSNRFASQRLVTTIQNKLDNVFSLISVTEGYLSEWASEIARSPGLVDAGGAYERLRSQFSREVSRAKHLAEQAKTRTHPPQTEPFDDASTVDSALGSSQVDHHFINSVKADPDYEVPMIQHFDVLEPPRESELLTDSLIEARTQGIKSIRTQIEQARGIFNDIATIVAVQDGGIQQLERNMKDSHENSEESFKDIESLVVSRRSGSRRNALPAPEPDEVADGARERLLEGLPATVGDERDLTSPLLVAAAALRILHVHDDFEVGPVRDPLYRVAVALQEEVEGLRWPLRRARLSGAALPLGGPRGTRRATFFAVLRIQHVLDQPDMVNGKYGQLVRRERREADARVVLAHPQVGRGRPQRLRGTLAEEGAVPGGYEAPELGRRRVPQRQHDPLPVRRLGCARGGRRGENHVHEAVGDLPDVGRILVARAQQVDAARGQRYHPGLDRASIGDNPDVVHQQHALQPLLGHALLEGPAQRRQPDAPQQVGDQRLAQQQGVGAALLADGVEQVRAVRVARRAGHPHGHVDARLPQLLQQVGPVEVRDVRAHAARRLQGHDLEEDLQRQREDALWHAADDAALDEVLLYLQHARELDPRHLAGEEREGAERLQQHQLHVLHTVVHPLDADARDELPEGLAEPRGEPRQHVVDHNHVHGLGLHPGVDREGAHADPEHLGREVGVEEGGAGRELDDAAHELRVPEVALDGVADDGGDARGHERVEGAQVAGDHEAGVQRLGALVDPDLVQQQPGQHAVEGVRGVAGVLVRAELLADHVGDELPRGLRDGRAHPLAELRALGQLFTREDPGAVDAPVEFVDDLEAPDPAAQRLLLEIPHLAGAYRLDGQQLLLGRLEHTISQRAVHRPENPEKLPAVALELEGVEHAGAEERDVAPHAGEFHAHVRVVVGAKVLLVLQGLPEAQRVLLCPQQQLAGARRGGLLQQLHAAEVERLVPVGFGGLERRHEEPAGPLDDGLHGVDVEFVRQGRDDVLEHLRLELPDVARDQQRQHDGHCPRVHPLDGEPGERAHQRGPHRVVGDAVRHGVEDQDGEALVVHGVHELANPRLPAGQREQVRDEVGHGTQQRAGALAVQLRQLLHSLRLEVRQERGHVHLLREGRHERLPAPRVLHQHCEALQRRGQHEGVGDRLLDWDHQQVEEVVAEAELLEGGLATEGCCRGYSY